MPLNIKVLLWYLDSGMVLAKDNMSNADGMDVIFFVLQPRGNNTQFISLMSICFTLATSSISFQSASTN